MAEAQRTQMPIWATPLYVIGAILMIALVIQLYISDATAFEKYRFAQMMAGGGAFGLFMYMRACNLNNLMDKIETYVLSAVVGAFLGIVLSGLTYWVLSLSSFLGFFLGAISLLTPFWIALTWPAKQK